MVISSEAYKQLVEHNIDFNSETGGILGGKNGTVSKIAWDKQIGDAYTYSPNTEFLNAIISDWSSVGIEFMGIFHTHHNDATFLSRADARYINRIAYDLQIETLYFPLVFQNHSVMVFCTVYMNGTVDIIHDEIEIV